MEEISATYLHPSSNKSLTVTSCYRELTEDKTSDFQHLNPVGSQADIIVPQRGRKPRRKVQQPQQQVSDQEKDAIPLRPLRRKDSLTPDRKNKSDDLSVKLSPVCSGEKDDSGDVISKQPAIFNPNKGNRSIHQVERQKEHSPQKRGAQVTPHTGEHHQQVEVESLHISMDVVPPPRVKRDGTCPPEAAKRTVPCKPLRRRDNASKERVVSKTNDQQNLQTQVNSSLRASDPDVSGVPELLQSSYNDCEKFTEMVPSSLSIIQRIRPSHAKRWTSSKSATNESDKEMMAQNSNVATMECVKPVQMVHTVIGDVEQIKQSNIVGDVANDTTRIASFQKSEDPSEIAAEKQTQTKIHLPKPRMRKHLSGPLPGNITTLENISKASHEDVTHGIRLDSSLLNPSTTKDSLKVQHSEGVAPFSLGNQPSISAEVANVTLRRSRFNVKSNFQGEDGHIIEKTPGALNLPVPKPRIKKRLSGSFPDEITISDSPRTCLPDKAADTVDTESIPQNGQSNLPSALPRAKKCLSAPYSDSTPHVKSLLPQEKEFGLKNPEDEFITNRETKECSGSLDSSVISEGGFVRILAEDDISSELEREVLEAMAEDEFPHAEFVEDAEKALDEIMEGWTFTSKPVAVYDLEKDTIPAEPATEKVVETEVNRSFVVDDWLHVVNDEDNELKSRKEFRDEELDFGFVSVDVATSSLKEER